MNDDVSTWKYDGPIKRFNEIYLNHWVASTCAKSSKKALSNLTYRAKKEYNIDIYSNIKLDPKYLTKIES